MAGKSAGHDTHSPPSRLLRSRLYIPLPPSAVTSCGTSTASQAHGQAPSTVVNTGVPAAPVPQQPAPNPVHSLPQFVNVNAALPVAMPQPAGGGGAAANGQPQGVACYAWYEVIPGPHPLSAFPGPRTRIRRRIGRHDVRQGLAA